jgi:SfnB family sulfur acquisition oxidoreductase
VGKVFEILAAADPSFAQIPQSHMVMTHLIRVAGTDAQKKILFEEILKGIRLGNAAAEFSKEPVSVMKTRLSATADGFLLNGRKFYATGALTAHIVTVTAIGDDGKPAIAFVDRTTPGLRIINDWAAFGQRTTASGTVVLEDLFVAADRVIPASEAFTQSPLGAIAQILHSGIDVGIASEAIKDTIHLVRNYARPWRDANQEHGYEDPYSIAQVGDLEIRLHASQAMLERAGRAIDAALTETNEDSLAAASVAAAEAKVLAADIAIHATNKLFELVGARATLSEHNLDRHWRNARTHTLHDPVRWKMNVVGNYYLNGIKPPRHPLV